MAQVDLDRQELGLLLEALDKAQLAGKQLRRFVSVVEGKLELALAEASKAESEPKSE